VAAERVYGVHAVRALLARRPRAIERLWLQRDRADVRARELAELAAAAGIKVGEKSAGDLDEMSAGGVHQGALAEVAPSRPLGEDELDALVAASLSSGDPPLLLILDGVQDPHNLGAILRSADGAGVACVIAPRDRAAGLGPAARKVAAGAAETMPFAQVTNLARCMDGLKAQGYWLIGAAGEASEEVYDVDLNGPVALVMGAEGEGMRRLTRERCDRLVRLPMQGAVGSLNVSVATGILLYEALRQRRTLAKTKEKT
jgi:23S rRNA (guanosine2251-2'-O)-methyltransferase